MRMCVAHKGLVIFAFSLALAGLANAQDVAGKTEIDMWDLPRVFCLDPVRLAKSKRRVAAGDKSLRPAIERLQESYAGQRRQARLHVSQPLLVARSQKA